MDIDMDIILADLGETKDMIQYTLILVYAVYIIVHITRSEAT